MTTVIEKHRRRTRIAGCAVGLPLLAGMGAQVAAAKPPSSQTMTATKGPPGAPGPVISCTAQVNDAHKSTHVPETVNTVASVNCTSPVSIISLNVFLYWSNNLVASANEHFRYNVASTKNNAAVDCATHGDGVYRGNANGWVVFGSGYTPSASHFSVQGDSIYITC